MNSFTLRLPPDITVSYLSGLFKDISLRVSTVLVPVLLAIMISSVTANLLQGGLVFSSQALGFHFEQTESPKRAEKGFLKKRPSSSWSKVSFC